MRLASLLIGVALLVGCGGTQPPSAAHAWARATASGQDVGVVYVSITGGEQADRLVGASVPASIAASAELHVTSMDGATMSMQATDGIDVPLNTTVELKPGGSHIMLMRLAHPLTAGETFPVTLAFEHGGDVTTTATVKGW